MIVPTFRVGMHLVTLRVANRAQSVQSGIPTQRVGTIMSL
jgi:hypothetical protein